MRGDVNESFEFLVFFSQIASELRKSFFVSLPFSDVGPDSDVLVGFTLPGQERKDSRIDPINCAVFGPVAQFALPDLPAANRGPKVAKEFFGMESGIDDAMVL